MDTVDLGDLDLPMVETLSPDYLADPHGTWRAVRLRHWLAYTELGLNVLAYDAVTELLRSRSLVVTGDAYLQLQGITSGVLHTYWTNGLLAFIPGQRHDRLRALMTSAFAPRTVEAMRRTMREVAQRLVAEFAPLGHADLVTTFAHRYPMEIIARMIGIPPADINRFAHWSTDIGLAFAFPVAPVLDRVEAAIAGMFHYAGELIERRRSELGEDLLSRLISEEQDGDRLSTQELQWQLVNLTFGGHDTARSALAYLLRAFCDQPDQWELLAENPNLAANAVAEGLRLHPIAPAHSLRTATTNIVHGGVRIPTGTMVILRADAANRDPLVFPDPDRFNIARPNAAQHVTFGAGVHYCLGAYLAMAELTEALPILAQAMPKMRVAGVERWRPYSSAVLGPEQLPLSWAIT